jgi:arylsulfatase A-like enzyme
VPGAADDGRRGFDRRADVVAARAVAWFERRKGSGRPFFLWVHFYDPHWPYVPPEPFRTRFGASPEGRREETVALYDGEIAFADAALGTLLERLDREDLAARTLVVVLGDHGEGLGEHGHAQHGLFVYEEAVRVPWVMRWTGRLAAGRRIRGPVELVDLLPTVLELLGLEVPAGVQGQSLVPALRGEPLQPERPVFFQRRRFDSPNAGAATPVRGEKFGVRRGRWKYIEAPAEATRELYDLAADPDELENLVDRFPEEAAALAALLEQWRAQHASAPARADIPPQTVEALRALGYVQ